MAFQRREDWVPPKTSAESPFRDFVVHCLRCGSFKLRVIGAHDTDCDEVRTFALGRITTPVLTGETFQIPASFDPTKYLSASFSVMKGDGDYEVVIEFDAWATDLLRGRQWHPTQTVQQLPGGASQMKMRLSGLEEVERWILSWGTHANVLRPAPLATRIHQITLALAMRYQPTTESLHQPGLSSNSN